MKTDIQLRKELLTIEKVNILKDGRIDSYMCKSITFPTKDVKCGQAVRCSPDDIYRSSDVVDNCASVPLFILCWLIHFFFKISLYCILSFNAAYAVIILVWWVLGAIINPERMLVFAAAGMVYIGTAQKVISDFKAMRHNATLQKVSN